MPASSPARHLRRVLALLPFVLVYGCTDGAVPTAPRVEPRPHALLAPVVTVTNTDDSGPGSFRQAIIDAPDGAVIQFDASIAGQTIVLTTGPVQIANLVTVEGPLPKGMTISGNLNSRVFGISSTANVTFRNLSIVNGNDPDSNGGGAIFLVGNALFDHVLIANSQSGFTGGAIFVKSTALLTLVNSTMSGNSGKQGGAINSNGIVTIWNSTIANNRSEAGGGIYAAAGTVYLRNSIVANNIDTDNEVDNDPNCLVKPGVSVQYAGRNLSDDTSCGHALELGIVGDPALGPLADNGGPTKTHALGAASFAIDFGDQCTESTDQRYVARNQGTTCDIGAFEFTDFGTLTVTVGPNVAVNAKTGSATLTGTIACSRPGSAFLNLSMSQTQKATGRFTTIVDATATLAIPACGPSPKSWSAAITPPAGRFESGSATGKVAAFGNAKSFLPATVTSPLKLFNVK